MAPDTGPCLPRWEQLRKEAGGLPTVLPTPPRPRPHPHHSYLWRMLSQHHVIAPSRSRGMVSVFEQQKPSLHIEGGKGFMRQEGAMPMILRGTLQRTL